MNGNDFAFPNYDPAEEHLYPGLTKREHIAALVMQAMLINGKYTRASDTVSADAEAIAYRVAVYTDALINRLNKL